MTLKLVGIVVVILSCTMAGLMKSITLSRRVRELEYFISAFNYISTEIRYLSSPVDVIISNLVADSDRTKPRVFELCLAEFQKSHDFKASWLKAVSDSKPFLSLTREDVETLIRFGDTFGTTDSQGELANCNIYMENFRQRLACARSDKSKRAHMYLSLGLLTGVLIAAVLI